MRTAEEAGRAYRNRARFNYAVRIGKVKRQPCERCGEKKSEAHHPDLVNDPFRVVWLCRKHHKMEDGVGRPPLSKDGTARISVRIPVEWVKRIEKMVDAENDFSAVVRMLVRRGAKSYGVELP